MLNFSLVGGKTFTQEEVYAASLEYFGGDELAADVFASKYALRDLNNVFYEKTPTDMHRRMAREFARIEAKYSNPMSEEEIFELFQDWTVVPQGSPQSTIGNPFQYQTPSNCYVVAQPFDSYSGIFLMDQELAQIYKRRGGTGVDLSTLRPENTVVQNAARTTSGLLSWMKRISNTCKEVGQSGRRGALLISVDVRHPDIFTFVRSKRSSDDVDRANISVKATDEFMLAVRNDTSFELSWPVGVDNPKVRKTIRARDLWDEIVLSAWMSGDPGFLFWDTVTRETLADAYTNVGYGSVCTNPCFAPGTLIPTRQGVFKIEELVGKTVDVWDGSSWVSINNFRVTGENQELLRIELHDGSTLDVTPNHTMILDSGEKLPAQELLQGMRLMISTLPVSHSAGEDEPGSYAKGFMVADGCVDAARSRPILYIYPPKYVCTDRLIKSLGEIPTDVVGKRSDCKTDLSVIPSKSRSRLYVSGLVSRPSLVYWGSKAKEIFPYEIYRWSYTSQCDFLAGLFDGDGGASDTKNGFMYQICSIHKQFLFGLQGFLKSLGIASRVAILHEKTSRDFNDGYGAYESKQCWRLTISQQSSILLSKIVSFSRLMSFEDRSVIYTLKPKFNKIKKITPIGVAENVYCCTVPGKHQLAIGVGVMTGNCGEVDLSPYDSCRLLLLNLFKFVSNPFTSKASFDKERFVETAKKAQRLMDDLVDLDLECVDRILNKIKEDPEPDDVKLVELSLWKKIRLQCENGRRTGLGITALADCFAALGIKYGSEESIRQTDEIYSLLAYGSFSSTITMAKERGVFPVYKHENEKSHPYVLRLLQRFPDLEPVYAAFGRRNIGLLTTSPGGSVSLEAQTTSSAEPLFKRSFSRKRRINSSDAVSRTDHVDDKGEKWQVYTVEHHGIQLWREVTGETDVELSPYWGASSDEVSWEARMSIQATAQKWIDHSISNTVNLPQSATQKNISDIYMRAWELGCKGVTVFRDKCKEGVLVELGSLDKQSRPATISESHAPKRPKELDCDIHRATVRGESYLLFVGLLDNKPYEIFCGSAQHFEIPKKFVKGKLRRNGKNKDGFATYDLVVPIPEFQDPLCFKDIATLFSNPTYGAFSRTISLSLRHGVPVEYLVEQLRKDKHSDVTSFSSVVARLLSKHYTSQEKQPGGVCPSCSSVEVVKEAGCLTCQSCGYSKCS